jgi:hypothetical protein
LGGWPSSVVQGESTMGIIGLLVVLILVIVLLRVIA